MWGKGSNDRMYIHVQKVKRGDTTSNPHLDRKITKLIRNGIDIEYVKFHDSIENETEFYALEEAKTREIGINNLCNAWYGGKGGRRPSAETRQKISQNRKGIPVSAETREKMKRAKLGTKMSEETREKKQQALIDKPQSAAQAAANASRSASLKSRQFSDEHRQKLRDAKKRKQNDQHNE